jgi:hypothetical protein
MSELLWVAIPGGLTSAGGALVRVLVVPRLDPGNISDVGMDDWPAALASADFRLITKTPQGPEAEHPAVYQGGAQSTIWREFFGGAGGNVEQLNLTPHPAPTVTDTYTHAQNATDTVHAVTTKLATPSVDSDAVINQELTRWKGAPAQNGDADTGDPEPRILDFHRSVSMLREHPSVLTALGLIIELVVSQSDLDTCDPAMGYTLSARCASPSLLRPPFVVSRWTRYEFGPRVFRPAPGPNSSSGVRAGLLNLDQVDLIKPSALQKTASTPAWALATFDIDGAVASLRQAAATVGATATPTAAAPVMPPIRSLGISLLQPGRTTDLTQRTQRAANAAADAELTADDLILGYRVDIKTGGNWLPLCERDATYSVNDTPIGSTAPKREEGQVKPFSAVKTGDALFTDQLIVHWAGWSLAAPVVKLTADPAGMIPAGPVGDRPYDFKWALDSPLARLPKLRFAARYQMRIRIADLAGGGVHIDEVPDGAPVVTEPIVYARYDPLLPPILQSSTASYGPGGAIDRLVIRSDVGISPKELYASNPNYPDPANEMRELAPPTAALTLVEQHGSFDGLPVEQSWPLAQRAIAADPNDPSSGLPEPAAAGIEAFIAHGTNDAPPTADLSVDTDWTPKWPGMLAKSIKLQAAGPGADDIAIDRSSDSSTLIVTLAQGQQTTIELSSTIRNGWQDHFAMFDWLDQVPLGYTMGGRNPVVTPPRKLLAVHAVRTPLSKPLWDLPGSSIKRGQGDTSALLQPHINSTGPGVDGLNTPSTGRLDVAASWAETNDVGPEASATTETVAVEHLFSTHIEPGAAPALQIRHEFGDTKHRTVYYTLNAITRYREYFESTEDDRHFHVSAQQAPADILSSARPGPLTVLGVVPAFAWQPPQISADRIEHIRLGGRIRVELARPWFQTGDGEQLGILVAPPGASPADDERVTQMGRDPVFGAPSPPRFPTASAFIGAGQATLLTLPDTGQPISVVPFTVAPGVDRWIADVTIDPQALAGSYNPFIQLALARYQPSSLPGIELSTVVITDKVPVLPDRRMVVQRNGAHLVLTVTGTGPQPANIVQATLEQASDPSVAEDIDMVATGAAVSGVPAWMPVATVSGSLGSALPALALATPPARLRLRVTESEALPPISASAPPIELTQRTVFLDTIMIPAEWQH